jgi:hypothetical protein
MSIPNLKVTLGISLKIEEYYAKHPGITQPHLPTCNPKGSS